MESKEKTTNPTSNNCNNSHIEIFSTFMNGPKKKTYLIETYSKYPCEIITSEDKLVREIIQTLVPNHVLRPLELTDEKEKSDQTNIKLKGIKFTWMKKDTKYVVWFAVVCNHSDFKDSVMEVMSKKTACCWSSYPMDKEFSYWCSKGVTRKDILDQVILKQRTLIVEPCLLRLRETMTPTVHYRYVPKEKANSKQSY